MGVDLATYRGRIGTFRFGTGVDVVILHCTIHFSICLKYIGSVAFIGILLFIAGIEQNPGPTHTGLNAKRLDIDNPLYKNWVRAATGLKYLKLGLQEFIDQQIKRQHQHLLQSYIKGTGHPATSCSSCTSENLMPAHPTRICIQKLRRKCFCKDHQTRRICPNNFCSRFYDLIVRYHAEANPLWANTDPTLWFSNYFEFAKCFLGTTSNTKIHSITDIDATGLLSIAINNLYIHDAISCIDTFEQCRNTRNEIAHAKSFEVEDTQLECYIDKMIAVLRDERCMCNYQSALEAIEKLEQLKKDQIHISSEDAEEMRRQSLAAISEITEKSINDIDTKKLETLRGLDEHTQQSKSLIAENTDAALKSITDFGMENKSEIQRQLASEMEERKTNMLKEINEQLKNKIATTNAESYEADKKGLKQYLVELYQNHYVKTSASPLLTQDNDIDISDVYVSPNMVAKEKGHTDRQINRYQDIFLSNDGRNKKVFIIGDAGTGKSSFCKMMMQNWCRAVEKRESGKQKKHENDDKTNDMDAFDFLFYVPLNIMSGYSDDISEMIKAQLEDYRALIEKILSIESECCLILADGLDEWKPHEKTVPRLQHVTYGIPRSDRVRNATLITTSRPSACGVLDMKSTEYDLKVTLLGVNEMSHFVEKYVTLLLKSSSAVDDFQRKLSQTCIRPKNLQEAPMLLQQIIFMYCEGREIGQSVAHIYSNIVNIVFGWLDEKRWERIAVNKPIKPQLLPKHFDNFDRCQENRDLIILLGNVAYSIFVKEDNVSVVLGRRTLEEFGFKTENIAALLQLGILKEEKCVERSKSNLQISFVHTSYLEFFAAVYISSCFLSETDTEPLVTKQNSLIKDLILNKASATKILRLKNLLIMVCGLSPLHTESICDCIYQVASRDVQLMEYRRSLKQFSFYDCYGESYGVIVEQIQDICFSCVSESKTNSEHMQPLIKLCDLWLSLFSHEQLCFSCVDYLSVITFVYVLKDLSHEVCTSLLSFLSHSVSLNALQLYQIRSNCKWDECDEHIINLSRNEQLQKLVLSECDHISVSGINPTTNLKSCEIIDCTLTHEQCKSLSLFLSRAVSLQSLILRNIKCTQPECDGHTIDLSCNVEIQYLVLSVCKHISVSGISPSTNLKSCEIIDCTLKHQQCESLSLYLSRPVLLQSLILGNIKCTHPECDGHIIDLSRNEKLQKIELSNCYRVSVSRINLTTNLNSCEIIDCTLTHEQCKSLSLFLSRAVSLQSLILRYIKCTQPECDGYTIDLSCNENLQSLVLSVCNHISVSGISPTTNLNSCEIGYNFLTHEQCKSLALFLSQAISLQSLILTAIKCSQPVCDGHTVDLSRNTQLQNIELSHCYQISVSGINSTTNLISCEISYSSLTHEQCKSLALFLSRAVSLQSLILRNIKCTQAGYHGHMIDISSNAQLQKIELSNCYHISVSSINPTTNLNSCEISDCSLTHEQCKSLSLFLSRAVSLPSLILRKVKCTQPECDGHTIDLSCHEKLQKIEFSHCYHISISGINPTTNLKSCEIIDCTLTHEQCKSLSLFLSRAVSLQSLTLRNIKCTQAECDGHTIDQSRNEQLQKIKLSNCQHISLSGINPTTNLKSCKITNCSLTHNQCKSLSSFLSRAVLLESLTLRAIQCTLLECDGHTIDISLNEQLQSLVLSNCDLLSLSGISPTTNFKSCEISSCPLTHEQCESLSLFLSQAVSLWSLTLRAIQCTQPECDGHRIDLSIHKQLQSLWLDTSSQIYVYGANPTTQLTSCKFNYCTLSHQQWSSLTSFLSQAVSAESLELCYSKCMYTECDGHSIDLSNHENLKSLRLHYCGQIYVSGVNRNLKACKVINCKLSHQLLTSLTSFLSQAVSLDILELCNTKCMQLECDGHSMDLSCHKQLVILSLVNCNFKYVFGANLATNLKSCSIMDSGLSDEQWTSLSEFLLHAVSLELVSINISNIKCTQVNCKGHAIDLSNHKQLKDLWLVNKKAETKSCVSSLNLN